MNKTESFMTVMKSKDAINLDTAILDKFEAYPGEELLLEDCLYSMENKWK